jgi:excisionase family DNA binding protein
MLMPVLLTTRQAAERCSLSPRTLEKLRVSGGGPHYLRLGGSVRYQLEDLDSWIESSRRRTTSDDQPGRTTSPARTRSRLFDEPPKPGTSDDDPESGTPDKQPEP